MNLERYPLPVSHSRAPIFLRPVVITAVLLAGFAAGFLTAVSLGRFLLP
jgi:hypothetical protein